MKNSKKSKRSSKRGYLALLLIVFISVGFATLTTTLSIIGNTTIRKNVWDVHFNNMTETANSNVDLTGDVVYKDADDEVVTDITKATKIEFAADLTTPGDTYEFTIDVVNAGTIDAKLLTYTKSAKSENDGQLTIGANNMINSYMSYTVEYVDNSTEPAANDALAKGYATGAEPGENTKTIKVTVKFEEDIDAEDLPAEDDEITCALVLEYQQA